MNAKKGFLALFRANKAPKPDHFPERFYYEQIAASVGAGGWTIDLIKKKSYFDKQLRAILDTPEGYKPSFKHALHFYEKASHDRVIDEFQKLESGIACEHEIKMLTYNNKPFWAKCIGKPIFDKRDRVVGIRGIILNIDATKEREISLEKSLFAIEGNNDRLFKFANHISHSLKNQIHNLELTSQLIDSDSIPKDQVELFNNYKEIAQSLSKTVKQLNEIVSIQNKAKKELVTIDLQEIFEKCKSDLQELIQQQEGYVYSDFSEAPEIQYNLNFFQNIFCTLIQHGLRNPKSGRKPEVKAYSLENKGKISVVIEDNGAGLEASEDDEFLYYTADSGAFKSRNKAVNLFVIKNQVEALGGDLKIESRTGYGTKFIINI